MRGAVLTAALFVVLAGACGDGATAGDADDTADPGGDPTEPEDRAGEADDAEPDDGGSGPDDGGPDRTEVDGAEDGEAEDAGEPEDGAEAEEGDAPDGETTGGRRFSFVQLTDLHIGEGHDDYGTSGWDDSGGDEDDNTMALRVAVAKVNLAVDDYDIRFVVATGDLSDSGERSEVERAKLILDQLNVPYFPLIGNHDIWPYTAAEEAPQPEGDRLFEETFLPQFEWLADLFPSFVRAATPVDNPECDCESRFINYGLDYEGYHFVMLDMVSRTHAPLGSPGVASDANLYDFVGGTWDWLTNHLETATGLGDRNTFVFVHHPPIVTTLGILDCLSPDEVARIDDFLRDGGFGANLWGFFAGHHHLNYTLPGYEGQTIVVTAATKDGSTARLIQLYDDGRVDIDTFL